MQKAPFGDIESAANRGLDLASQFVPVRGALGDVAEHVVSTTGMKVEHGIDISVPKL